MIAAFSIDVARHITVAPQGDVYIKPDGSVNGKDILFLHDDDNKGRTEKVTGFSDYDVTSILVKDGCLYASSNNDISL